MNIELLLARLNRLLEKLKEDLPLSERIATAQEAQEIVNKLFN